MDIIDLSTDEQLSILLKPIIASLQEAGGSLTRTQLKDSICEKDDDIAAYAEIIRSSKKTGNTYKPFNFKFNFAITELILVGIIIYGKSKKEIQLTEKGVQINLDLFDIYQEVRIPASMYWEEKARERAKLKEQKGIDKKGATNSELSIDIEDNHDDEESIGDINEGNILDDVNVKLQEAIKNMSPAKFEQFSRLLLTKMGITFTNKGISISNDGGIDGYGYHMGDDFRTTRVVIQCKRYTVNPVGEPDINQFLGAMNKFQADYGVFITSSRFTTKAREAAREGSPITLIDGDDLVELIIKYELFVTPVTTYILEDFYRNDEC
jgi:restriction endonuclease